MSAKPPLSILFLWHQHQPFYKDPVGNKYEMPWVRLHATKDYYDMVALCDEFPKLRLNFNLVPSLVAQLEDYAQGRAQDRFLDVSRRPAQELTFDDRLFLLQNFFMAHWENMIDPYPRYRELLERRGRSAAGEYLVRAVNYFKEGDWRDLQTWFNLTWMDPWWDEKDPFIRALRVKGRNFTEEEKLKLLEKQQWICGQVISKHREVMERGQIEITATPFYHPILPLLCDTDAARMATPEIALPESRFTCPEDARHQILKALDFHQSRFGRRPQGMWPSEGSVSEATADLLMDAGVRWIATDEGVLANSFKPAAFHRDDIYQLYRYSKGGRDLHLYFRDHELSDAIGFVYSGWKSTEAIDDFMAKLHGIRDRLARRDGGAPAPAVVPVILDGENCWEYYKHDGLPFLRELYARISEDPTLDTVLGASFVERAAGTAKTLSNLWSGSWINSNFGIWIGHREDNRAWDLLHRTRRFLVQHLEDNPDLKGGEQALLAWESIYIAEGSDWNWWYGDDHSSANDQAFDYLFRKHLMNVYTVLGVKVPEDLHLPIKAKRQKAVIEPAADFITPTIDGRVTSYFEWRPAGFYDTEAGGTGTMHRTQNVLKSIHFGFDLEKIYLRLDFRRALDYEYLKGMSFRVLFLKPQGYEVLIRPDLAQKKLGVQLRSIQTPDAVIQLQEGAIERVAELAIPLKELGHAKGTLDFCITVDREGLEQERWPVDSAITIPYPHQDTFAFNWSI